MVLLRTPRLVLRGWVEEKPQTVVVWRKYLPLRIDDDGPASFSSKKETDKFFNAAPPLESEKLETETFQVADWLRKRAAALLERKPRKEKAETADADSAEHSRKAARARGA